MYARVVRFTDVSSDRVAQIKSEIEDGGPPPGVPAKAVKLIYDEGQSTAVVVLFFASEDDMRKGGEELDKMDTGDTPGSRASVDQGEVKAEMEA